jgi:hypothetical protein
VIWELPTLNSKGPEWLGIGLIMCKCRKPIYNRNCFGAIVASQ